MLGFGKSEQPDVEMTPEQLKEKAMKIITGRLSVGSGFDRHDALRVIKAWDYLDEDLKKDLPTAFPDLAREILRRKLGIEALGMSEN